MTEIRSERRETYVVIQSNGREQPTPASWLECYDATADAEEQALTALKAYANAVLVESCEPGPASTKAAAEAHDVMIQAAWLLMFAETQGDV